MPQITSTVIIIDEIISQINLLTENSRNDIQNATDPLDHTYRKYVVEGLELAERLVEDRSFANTASGIATTREMLRADVTDAYLAFEASKNKPESIRIKALGFHDGIFRALGIMGG